MTIELVIWIVYIKAMYFSTKFIVKGALGLDYRYQVLGEFQFCSLTLINSSWLDSTRLDWTRLNYAWLHLTPLESTWLNLTLVDSNPLNSTQLYPAPPLPYLAILVC